MDHFWATWLYQLTVIVLFFILFRNTQINASIFCKCSIWCIMYIAKLLYIAADNTVSVFIVYVAIYQITDSNQKLCDCVCPVYYHVRWLCSVGAVYFLLPASLSDVYQCSQWGRLSTERLLRNMLRFRSEYHHVGSRVVSVLDSGTVGPGFKSQSRRCRVTVLGKLFTPIVPLFTKQWNW